MEFKKARLFDKARLKVHTDEFEGVPVLIAIGEADAYSVTALKEALDYAVKAGVSYLIVDLRAIDYLDGSSHQALVDGKKKLDEIGCKMVVVNTSGPTSCILTMLGLDTLMPVVRTLQQALRSIREQL
ncbi:MAG TPA: STAS domain-containing protein [Anaerolineae bacterium]|jgi:anti-anti-sigma factor|nr:STAS domain-containing protein [Anaerolineae bacterium]